MIINTMIAFILAAITSMIVAPLMIKFAFKVGAVDVPKDERKIHSKQNKIIKTKLVVICE